MDGMNDDQAGVPVGALASAATEGGPARGWGRVAAVPAGAPAAMTMAA
jgi:hypothetical protein